MQFEEASSKQPITLLKLDTTSLLYVNMYYK